MEQIVSNKTQLNNKGESDIQIRREVEFNLYLQWKSLPSILRGKPIEVLEQLGFEPGFATELLQIKTQKEFAEKYDLNEATLVNWNKRPELLQRMKETEKMLSFLTPNVFISLYKTILKDGSAQEVHAWMKYIEHWKEDAVLPQPVSIVLQQQTQNVYNETKSDTEKDELINKLEQELETK